MKKYNYYKKEEYSFKNTIAKSCVIFVCTILLLLTGIMFYCNTFLTLYPVSQQSMSPSLNANGIDEDFVYVSSNTKYIKYKDIVVCKKDSDLVIKRVIAMPGDNILIKQAEDGNYSFFIQYNSKGDWQKLEEDYIKDKSVYASSYETFYNGDYKNFNVAPNGDLYLHINDDEIFLAGDNRLFSRDCIKYGALPLKDLIGEVVYVVHGNNLKVFQVFKQFLGFIEWK